MENHRLTLESKPAFKLLIEDIHNSILKQINDQCINVTSSIILEIGAGVIPLSSLDNQTISTDIEASKGLHCIASAMGLPFKNSSIRAVVAQNVFHHIPNPDSAMEEFSRILADGGIVVLIEPYFGLFASLVYPALFSSEGYDKKLGLNVSMTDNLGNELPNQAISYQYFSAGKLGEVNTCLNLEVVFAEPMPSGLRYLVSGALNFRKITPDAVLKFLRYLEGKIMMKRLLNLFAIHWMIVLKEKPQN